MIFLFAYMNHSNISTRRIQKKVETIYSRKVNQYVSVEDLESSWNGTMNVLYECETCRTLADNEIHDGDLSPYLDD